MFLQPPSALNIGAGFAPADAANTTFLTLSKGRTKERLNVPSQPPDAKNCARAFPLPLGSKKS
jgi:hypothetical protein